MAYGYGGYRARLGIWIPKWIMTDLKDVYKHRFEGVWTVTITKRWIKMSIDLFNAENCWACFFAHVVYPSNYLKIYCISFKTVVIDHPFWYLVFTEIVALSSGSKTTILGIFLHIFYCWNTPIVKHFYNIKRPVVDVLDDSGLDSNMRKGWGWGEGDGGQPPAFAAVQAESFFWKFRWKIMVFITFKSSKH